MIASGEATLDRIVALTFSEKAAAEMKLRLRGEIEEARRASQTTAAVHARLEAALEKLEVARIDTIHAFCADLLHEFPVAAGVDPLFEMAADDEQRRLLRSAFGGWFEGILEAPAEGVRRVLRRRTQSSASRSPREELLFAANTLIEHRDFPAAWRRDAYAREEALDGVMSGLADVASLRNEATDSDDWLAKSISEIAAFVDEVGQQESVRGRDHDALEASLRRFARVRHWRWKGSPRRPYSPERSRDEVLARRDEAKECLDRTLADCDADLAPLLREELRDVVAAYEAAKAKAGRLDFLDLLIRTRDLLQADPAVRRTLQRRYTHFFVDEFQDTDPPPGRDPAAAHGRRGHGLSDDWRAVTPPAPGKLFLVGDPKQSIYRFRRADVAIYEQIKQPPRRARCGEVLQL